MSVKTDTAQKSAVQAKESKKFNLAYAVIACAAFVLIALAIISSYYAKTFVMFSPEKVALQYVKNTMGADGYDALKYTILSKDDKMGNYLRENYMKVYVEKNKDAEAPKLTAEESGEKLTEILDKMYPSFVVLTNTYGFEKYDDLFSKYFALYATEHKAIYGHDIITYDDMFAAIEGNLATYISENAYRCELAYGKGEEYASKYLGKDKTITSEEEEENPYSAGYSILTEAAVEKEYTDDEVNSYIGSLSDSAKKSYSDFKIDVNDISAVTVIKVTCSYTGEGNTELINLTNAGLASNPTELTLVKIGSQWYVDITA